MPPLKRQRTSEDDDRVVTNLLANYMTPDCSNNRHSEKIKLVNKLLYMCEDVYCILNNMQRMSDLCKFKHMSISNFRDEVILFSRKYNIDKKQSLEQISKSLNISYDKIKIKYNRSLLLHNFKKKCKDDVNVIILFQNKTKIYIRQHNPENEDEDEESEDEEEGNEDEEFVYDVAMNDDNYYVSITEDELVGIFKKRIIDIIYT